MAQAIHKSQERTSCNFDLDLMTLIYEPDLDRSTRRCTRLPKMNLLGQGFQKLKHYRQKDRHTHIQINVTENINTPRSRVVKIETEIIFKTKAGYHWTDSNGPTFCKRVYCSLNPLAYVLYALRQGFIKEFCTTVQKCTVHNPFFSFPSGSLRFLFPFLFHSLFPPSSSFSKM